MMDDASAAWRGRSPRHPDRPEELSDITIVHAPVEAAPWTSASSPLQDALSAMRDGRALFLEGEVENAFAFNSVLSLPFVLDQVVPQLAAAAARVAS